MMLSNLNPIIFPIAILSIASATPPKPRAYAELTFPSATSLLYFAVYFFKRLCYRKSVFICFGLKRTTFLPASLNSSETIYLISLVVTAKEMSVGGTWICSKVPLMESFPPIAAIPSSFCALYAPSRDAKGLPHFSGSSPSLSKYSWKLKYTSLNSAPQAMSFDTDSTTAR